NRLIEGSEWCFTDGNAAVFTTKYFNDLRDIDQLDWRSIRTHDFRIDNSDNDTDRGRKKHAEFLIKEHVPSAKIAGIVVLNDAVKRRVERIVADCGFQLKVSSDMSDLRPRNNGESKFYF
ncbi:MAG: DarT ssDNA thymidine ADP-ribosyltransferase family protein, partial [Cyclobacteriaceae bacterium]